MLPYCVLARHLLWIFFLVLSFPVQAQKDTKPSVVLIAVDTILDHKQEKIQLKFNRSYRETPSMTSGKGWIRVLFPYTSFQEKLSFIRVNDGFIKIIRLFKQGKSTLLEIEFTDPTYLAQKGVQFFPSNRQFLMIVEYIAFQTDTPKTESVNKPANDSPNPDLKEPAKIPDSTQDRIAFGQDWGVTMSKMLVALFLVLTLLYCSLWLYKKVFGFRFSSVANHYRIKVVSSHYIGPKQKVVVVELNGEVYACGVTSNQINLISKIEQDVTPLTPKNPQEDKLNKLRSAYLKERLGRENPKQKIKNKSTKFNQELLNKIKQMKQID